MTHESPRGNALNTYGSAPEEWKTFYRTFENLRRNVLNKIFSLDPEKQGVFIERMTQKERESFSSVDNPEKYLVYHKSVGGSVGPISAPNLDFEGEHSLVKFYEELDKEIG